MTDPILNWVRRGAGETAVVFIHGFGGKSASTWGRFPSLVCETSALDGWDVVTMGYSTSLAPGLFEGLWSGDPSLQILAGLLAELSTTGDLGRYKALALVAHSMGGLVTQRALLDSAALRKRTSHVLLYGTPSAGLQKALWFKFWKRQVQDMAAGSEFITKLRGDWDETLAEPDFVFRAAAGDRDQFVPPTSSISPFPKSQQAVVEGNHVTMVKPKNAENLSVQVLTTALQGRAAPSGPWNSAQLALETLDFQAAIDELLPNRADLDQRNLVTLALALDAVGRGDESREVLENAGKSGTDARGVLAGRLKRQWNRSGRKGDAERALELYTDAYEVSKAAEDQAQAYYHGINVAFLTAIYLDDPEQAKILANEVLAHCSQAGRDHWCAATQGEARFYLEEWDTGFAHYSEALQLGATPREIESMYQQAELIITRLAPRTRREELRRRLDAVFGW